MSNLILCLRLNNSISDSLVGSFLSRIIALVGIRNSFILGTSGYSNNNEIISDLANILARFPRVTNIFENGIKNFLADYLRIDQSNLQIKFKYVPSNSLLLEISSLSTSINLGNVLTGVASVEGARGSTEVDFIKYKKFLINWLIKLSVDWILGVEKRSTGHPRVPTLSSYGLGSTSASGDSIAILDTGTSINHPSINSPFRWNTFNPLPFDPSHSVPDSHGHGTLMQELILRNLDPADLKPIVTVVVADGSGNCNLIDLIAGILYAEYRDCKYINISIGFASHALILKDIMGAMNPNVKFFCSAGNSGHNISSSPGSTMPHSPSMYSNALDNVYECCCSDDSINPTTLDGDLYTHLTPSISLGTSNYRDNSQNRMTFAAPGKLSLFSGTSLAAPIILANTIKAYSVKEVPITTMSGTKVKILHS